MLRDGEAWRLVLGDARAVLPTLEAGSVDAVIMDPPYGISYTTGFSPSCSWHESPIKGDESTELRDRVIDWTTERGLPWACFGTWKTSPPKGTRAALVWDKGPAFGMGDLSLPWKPSWELVFVGGPGWKGKRDEGVLRGPVVVSWESRGRLHPMQKPEWIAATLLKKLPSCDVVLDPFCGSGANLARRPGLTRAGRLFPAFCRRVTDLRRPADFDPFPANVYADFLDDRGQHEAARMLREAFPLGPPAELP
jgi:hypothetical protein